MEKAFLLHQTLSDKLLVSLAFDDDIGAIVNSSVFEDKVAPVRLLVAICIVFVTSISASDVWMIAWYVVWLNHVHEMSLGLQSIFVGIGGSSSSLGRVPLRRLLRIRTHAGHWARGEMGSASRVHTSNASVLVLSIQDGITLHICSLYQLSVPHIHERSIYPLTRYGTIFELLILYPLRSLLKLSTPSFSRSITRTYHSLLLAAKLESVLADGRGVIGIF